MGQNVLCGSTRLCDQMRGPKIRCTAQHSQNLTKGRERERSRTGNKIPSTVFVILLKHMVGCLGSKPETCAGHKFTLSHVCSMHESIPASKLSYSKKKRSKQAESVSPTLLSTLINKAIKQGKSSPQVAFINQLPTTTTLHSSVQTVSH